MGLGDKLRAAIQLQASSLNKGFIPLDQIDSIITKEAIRAEIFETPDLLTLFAEYGDILIDNILGLDSKGDQVGRRIKLFAILSLIGCVEKIAYFLDGTTTDDVLPISVEPRSAVSGPRILARDRTTSLTACFSSWEQSAIDAFEQQQWVVLAPVFGRDAPFFSLPTKAVLPFIHDEGFVHRRGGTSKIFRVKIHPSHLDTNIKEPLLTFAVKRVRSHEKDSFRRELQALRRFSSAGGPQHPNILEFLSAWYQDGHFNIIFPWAVSDLSEWWRNNPLPLRGSAVKATLWLANQALGITSGLSAVHRFLGSSEPNDLGYAGHHGDIKPGNILWFPDPENPDGLGTWKIADFGLSGVGSSLPPSTVGRLGCTPAYRAPEYDAPDHEITTAYDIWSLGCVLLECLTWSLIGLEGIKELESQRFETGTHPGKGDAAFWGISNTLDMDNPPSSRTQPTVKTNVIKWIEGLKNISKEQSFAVQAYVDELSALIEKKMLVVDERQRGLSTEMAAALQDMNDRFSLRVGEPENAPIDSSEILSRFGDEGITFTDSANNLSPLSVAGTLAMPDMPTSILDEISEAGLCTVSSTLVNGGSHHDIPKSATIPASTPQEWPSFAGFQPAAFDSTQFGTFATEPAACIPSAFDFANTQVASGLKRPRDTAVDQGSQGATAKQRRLEPSKPTHCTERHDATGADAAEQSTPPLSTSQYSSASLRFACPFHKHDPKTFGIHDPRWRTCVGPGWTTIHRVKEHIDRKHSLQPNSCSRCSTAFASPLELSQHQKSEKPCKASGANYHQVTEAQRALMRKRPRGRSEVGAWNDIYRIIFGLSGSDPVPWPYHEAAATPDRGSAKPSSQSEAVLLNDFEEYLTQNVIPSADRETMAKIQGYLDLARQFRESNVQSASHVAHDTIVSSVPSLMSDSVSQMACSQPSNDSVVDLSTINSSATFDPLTAGLGMELPTCDLLGSYSTPNLTKEEEELSRMLFHDFGSHDALQDWQHMLGNGV